jgi:hypothetical protein
MAQSANNLVVLSISTINFRQFAGRHVHLIWLYNACCGDDFVNTDQREKDQLDLEKKPHMIISCSYASVMLPKAV